MNYYLDVVKKYAVFTGRASRKEYWMFFLVNVIIGIALAIPLGILKVAAHVDLTFISHLYSLAVLCPSIGVGIRRLHDTDKAGWWFLLVLIPLIGPIVLLILFAQKGSIGDNRFGAPPVASITTSA